MGTRSNTYVYINSQDCQLNEDNLVVKMYGMYDGYPSGHGLELAKFLKGMRVGNGISSETPEFFANGMDCLAAQIVAKFKDGPGGFYLLPCRSNSYSGTDFSYHIGENYAVVESFDKVIFKGTWDEFYDFCKSSSD